MISAKVLKGRKVCSYVGIVDDMVNSGAHVVDAEVIVDGNIITCSYYGYVGKFMRAVFTAVEANAGRQASATTPALQASSSTASA
jgi:protease I